MSVFLLSYLLYGTPRTVELRPPAIEHGILVAGGLVPNDMHLSQTTSVTNFEGFRQPALVKQAIPIFQRATPATQACVRRSFGGNRMFAIARAMRLVQAKTMPMRKMVSEHPEVEPPREPDAGPLQERAAQAGQGVSAGGRDVKVLVQEAPHVVLQLMVDAWIQPQRYDAGSLPVLADLKAAGGEELSIKVNVV
ncbi:hypothetical protein BGZ92_000821 [Podila epicladia]|nr:hypothetical protein BGZ92_000821 [Podila epicladia]